MNIKKCGGNAFLIFSFNNSAHSVDASGGMTMRQYYKAAVMQGLCANPGGPFQSNSLSGWALVNSSFHQLSIEAGELADAMLVEDAEFEARS